MKVRLTPEAEADLGEILAWYIGSSEAVVVGCFHAHRDPNVWRIRAGV